MNNLMKGGERLLKLEALTLSLLMSCILGIASSYGAETVVVDKAFNGREIKVKEGGSIRVELEELGSAGYAWMIKDLDKDHFEVVSVDTKDKPQQGDITGAPVVRSWLISAKAKGMAVLKFQHYRPWEGEEHASDTFVLKVRIL
jgi:predicted secreted protein